MSNANWDVTAPVDHIKISQVPGAIRDVTSSAKIVLTKEHVQPSTDNAGGQHVKGSARVYLESALPLLDPEGNSLATGADTSDNGRLVCRTSISTTAGHNQARVYVATSAGVSTGWQCVSVGRVYLEEPQQCNGNAVNGQPVGTQIGQSVIYNQIDTTFFTVNAPATTANLLVKIGTGLQTAHADGIKINMTPLAYAGEESVILPNGLIMKMGHSSDPTGNQSGFVDSVTVTFGAAFPTAILAVLVTLRENTGTICSFVSSSSVSGFVAGFKEVQASAQTMAGFDWIAIGY